MDRHSVITAFLLMTITAYTASLMSCPLCIGTVKKDSPPFFDDELYKKAPKNELHLNLTVNVQQNQNDEGKDIQ